MTDNQNSNNQTNSQSGGDDLEAQNRELKAKLAEFRDNNRKLHNSNKTLTERLEGIEATLGDFDLSLLSEAKEALEARKQGLEEEMVAKGEIDKLIETRLAAVKKDHDKALGSMQAAAESAKKEADTLRLKLNDVYLDKSAIEAISKVGAVQEVALRDVQSRVRDVFQVDAEGEIVPRDANGDVIYGPSGGPLTLEEYGQRLLDEAPHLFKPSRGGGSKGNRTSGPTNGVKTISASDMAAFADNLDGVLSGDIQVTFDE